MAALGKLLQGRIPAITLVAIVGGLLYVQHSRNSQERPRSRSRPLDHRDAGDARAVIAPPLARQMGVGDPEQVAKLTGEIDKVLVKLMADESTNSKLQALTFLIRAFKSLPNHNDVNAAIRAWLHQGKDGPTNAQFAPGSGGSLEVWPSLRVALLDLLGELDRADAEQCAQEIFHSSNSPDEWAVALRNCGREFHTSPDVRKAQFSGYVAQLLSREDWLRAPTAGFLHAFDVAVFVGGDQMAHRLVSIHDSDFHSATSFAARMSLDRLAIASFASVASALLENPDHWSVENEARAAIMARGDPGDAHQVQLMHNYLANDAVGISEKQAFIRTFPNGNLELSNNLLTTNPFISMQAMGARDDAAARVLEEWSKESGLADLNDSIQSRLRALASYKASRLGNSE